MSQLNSLIAQAASIAGSEYKLAQQLGMPQPTISQWKSGARRCSPPDRAALADVAGSNVAAETIEAVIEGIDLETAKGQRARAALMKALKQVQKL